MLARSIKSSAVDTLIYGFGNVAVKVVGFILIPFYTNPEYLSVADYGALGILEITSQIMLVLMGLSLPQGLFRWYWDKDYSQKQKSVFFTSLSAQAIISILLCTLFILLAKDLSLLIFNSERFTTSIILLTLSSGLQSLNALITSLLRLQTRSLAYSLTNILKLLVVLGATLFLVVGRKAGISGVYVAQIIGNSLYILIFIPYIIRNISVDFDIRMLKGMMSFGMPLLWAGLFTVILNVIDRYSLNFISALESVAVYTLAFKIASTLKLVVADSIKLATGPLILKKMDTPDGAKYFTRIWLYSSYALMFSIVGLSLFSQEIIALITSSSFYDSAFALIPVMTLGIFFANLKDVNVNGLVISKKTGVLGIIVAIASAVGLGLNALLIPKFNTYGAATASFCSQLLFWIAIYIVSQKYYALNFDLRRLLLIITIGSAFAFGGILLRDIDLLPRLLIKFVILAAFPVAFIPLKFYEKAELEAAYSFIRKWTKIKNLRANLQTLKADPEL